MMQYVDVDTILPYIVGMGIIIVLLAITVFKAIVDVGKLDGKVSHIYDKTFEMLFQVLTLWHFQIRFYRDIGIPLGRIEEVKNEIKNFFYKTYEMIEGVGPDGLPIIAKQRPNKPTIAFALKVVETIDVFYTELLDIFKETEEIKSSDTDDKPTEG